MLLDLHRTDEAAALLADVLATDPANTHALCLLAQVRLATNDPSGALWAAQWAIAHDPDNDWPLRLASLAHLQLHDVPNAVAAARQAVHLSPNTAHTHVTLAQALARSPHQRDEAMAVANQAVALAPMDPMTHHVAGNVALARGDHMTARAALEHALRLDPNDADARNDLARVALHRSRSADSLAYAAHGFAATMRIDPRHAVGRSNLDVVLRTFLARTAYFVFVDCLIGYNSANAAGSPGAVRAFPVLLLLLPAGFAVRFLQRLDRTLRSYVISAARRREHAPAIGCQLVAAAAIIAGATLPTTTAALFGLAAISAGIGRMLLIVTGPAAPPGSGHHQQFFVQTWFIGLCGAGSGALGLLLLAAGTNAGKSDAVTTGLVLLLVALSAAFVVYRRQDHL